MSRWKRFSALTVRLVQEHPVGAALCAICLISLFTYSPLLFGQFLHFDDGQQIFDNLRVKEFSWANFADTLFTNYTGKGSAPSFTVSVINWALTPNYMGFVAVNLACFIGLTLLFFRFTALFIGDSAGRLAATLLFATHSLNTDALGWMSSRCHIMGATCIVLTFIFWQKYRDDISRPHRALWYLMAVMSAAAAVWNKGIFIVVPGLVVLYDLYRQRRVRILFFLDKIPIAILAALPFFFTPLKGGVTKFMRPGIGPTLEVTLLNDAGLILEYLYRLLVPGPTAVSIDVYPVQSMFDVSDMSSLVCLRMPPFFNIAVLALLSFLFMYLFIRHRNRIWFFLFALILVSLSPVMNIPPRWVDFGFRFEMMPLLFFCVALGSVFSFANLRLSGRKRLIPVALLVCLAAGHAFAAFRQARSWDTELTYWLSCTKNFPDSIVCRNKAAWLLESAGRMEEAAEQDRMVHEYQVHHRPNRPRPAAKQLAMRYRKMGKTDEAILYFTRSLYTDPLKASERKWVRTQIEVLKKEAAARR